jgi:hypothetical protein
VRRVGQRLGQPPPRPWPGDAHGGPRRRPASISCCPRGTARPPLWSSCLD